MSTVTRDRYGEKIHCGPTHVVEPGCVWLKCFSPHDWGRREGRRWVSSGRCNTMARFGCPQYPEPVMCCKRPSFASVKRGQQRKHCKECGALVPVWAIEQVAILALARWLRRE